ncbi:MAG: hypothetical protein IJF38_00405 [Clostridia bacterium]|nr:hypothetical protein [Clostridia bacterium]
MTKTMRREQNRIRRRNVRACYTSSWIALALVVLIAIIAGLTLDARAQSSGVLFTQDDQYELEQQLNDFNSFTFESEFYISPDFPDDKRGGVLMSNWVEDGALRDGNEWGIEIHFNGVVRVYHQRHGSIFFGIDAETGENITNTTHDGGVLDKNVGSAADVRTYTTGGRTVKIAIVFYASAGHASLFINGKFVCRTEDTTVAGVTDFLETRYKESDSNSPVFPLSTANPKHVIGGDHRTGNTYFFNGHIKNLAFYTRSRMEAEIIASQRADTFSPDLEDTSLQLALDMTQSVGPRIPDLSANNNDAVNKSVTSYNEDGYNFSSSNTVFKQEAPLPDLNSITLEAEVYLPSTLGDTSRGRVIMGNWRNSGDGTKGRDGNEWFLDIYHYGSVRFYHSTYGQYFFGLDKSTNPPTNVSSTSTDNLAKNDGSPADVRTYMADASGNPKYTKISVVIDTVTGYGHLYIDGGFICSMTSATSFKDKTFTASEVNPNIAIGSDYRNQNDGKFVGSIRNVSLYSDIRSENEIYEYGTSDDFAPDTNDPNLVFAYDLRYSAGGVLNDLSKNSIDAYSFVPVEDDRTIVEYIGTPSTRPETTGRGAAITDANAPLIYMYIDDDNDGVAEYNGAYLQFNGNADGTKGGAFADSNKGSGKNVYLVLQDNLVEYTAHFNNMPYISSDVFIDLNGFSLTAGSTSSHNLTNSIFSAECKGSYSAWKDPQITFFNSNPLRSNSNNGCIINNSAFPLIDSITYGGAYVGTDAAPGFYNPVSNREKFPVYDYFFEDITFKFGSSYSANTPFVRCRDATTTVTTKTETTSENKDYNGDGVVTNNLVVTIYDGNNSELISGMFSGVNITFNECTFDMSATTCAGNVIFDACDDSKCDSTTTNAANSYGASYGNTVITYGETARTMGKGAGTYTVINNTVINMLVNGGEIITGANIEGTNLYLGQKYIYESEGFEGINSDIRCDIKFGVGAKGDYIKIIVPEGTAPLDGKTTPIRESFTAVKLNDDDVYPVFSNGNITPTKNAFTFASLKDAGNSYPTEYTLRPSVQYEGKGDYVLANQYYSKNFAVFVTAMDSEGRDGNWKFLGSAKHPFDGEAVNGTVDGLSHDLLSRPYNNNADASLQTGYLNHVVAVMTKDCAIAPEGKYSNFAQIRGKLTYDLGGYTLTWNSSTRLINAEAKIGNYVGADGTAAPYASAEYMNDDPATGLYHKTRFEMKNGKFITSRSTLVVISAYSTVGSDRDALQYHNYEGVKTFELDFTNLTIAMTDEKMSMNALLINHYDQNHDNLINKEVRADITFTDCIFDLTNAQNVVTKTLFNATDPTYNTGSEAVKDGSGNITTPAVYNINTIPNITVNGGEIISKTQITDFKIADCFNITDDDLPHKNRANNNQGASVTFGRGSSFKYPTVTFPAGSTHPFPVFEKDTGVYLGDLNVTSNTATAGGVGSLHVYAVGPKGAEVCTNAEHIVEYTNPQNLLTYSKNDKLIDGSLVFHLEASREEDGDVGQNYSTYIPAYYYDLPDEYPFYVIDKNNTCVGVYSNWMYAADKIESFNNGVLFLKSDFTNGEHTTGNGAFSNINGDDDGNGGYAAGIFTIDLNGKTFTRSDSAYFIDLTLGGDAKTCSDKEVTVKNGTVVNNSNWGPICINYNSDYYSAGEASPYYSKGYTQYTLTFDKVDFISSTGSPTFWLWENGYNVLNNAAYAEKAFLKVDATFIDCNITSTHATYPAIPMRIPYSHDSVASAYDRTIFNVTVDGGSVTAASGNAFERNVDINTAEGHVNRTDNIFFVDDTSGNYPTLTLPTAKGQPMHVFLKSTGHYRGELNEGLYKLDAGEVQLSYIKDTVSGDNTVYKMAEPVAINNIRTATKTVTDGKVIANYSTFTGYAPACIEGLESAYPFWVFDGAQMLLATAKYATDTHADSAFQFANGLSMDNTIDRTVTVYLAADATITGDWRYTNLCYSYRAIAFDLAGRTVTVDKTSNWQALIYFEQKVPYDQRLVVVQNGSVELMNDASVVLFHTAVHEGNGYLSNHDVRTPNVVLKDLNIISNANHSEKAIVARPFATTTETQPRISADLKVINCTVDTSANANATVTLFDTADDYGRIKINPTLDGGSLIGNRDYGPFAIADDVDRMTFSNEVSGAYTTLTIPTASPRPLDVFKMNVDHGIFTEKSVSGDNTVYEIEHFQSLDLGIKTNLVFAQELLMMIYVPEDEEGNLTIFSVDGFEFRRSGFGGLNYRMIGGKKYYAVPVSLPAKEAARNIPVMATVAVDGAEFTVSFTVSLTKYASSVLSASTAPEKAAQKTLVLDTLAYIKSAYAYFNCADKTEVTAAIDEVLTAGGYSDKALTKSEGTTVATGLTSHTLLLESRPIIRLYVDKATYGESIFKFKQGDKDIPYITHYDSEGKIDYIDIALLAYRIPSEITYDIITEDREAHTTATVSGSYHINSYYDSAIAQNNETLTDIVKKFYLYCQSAKAYAGEVSS